jgi:hypothetical protein
LIDVVCWYPTPQGVLLPLSSHGVQVYVVLPQALVLVIWMKPAPQGCLFPLLSQQDWYLPSHGSPIPISGLAQVSVNVPGHWQYLYLLAQTPVP